jgi:hypothetical protein
MVYDNHLWYSPAYLIDCGERVFNQAKKDGQKLSGDTLKVMEETRTGALFALGLTVRDKAIRYIQPVDPTENTPDVRITHQIKSPLKSYNWGEYYDVEIVRYEEHTDAKISLADFIKQTKLNPKKAYQDGTIILCGIDRTAGGLQQWKDVAKELAPIKNNLSTFVLGRTHPTEWKIAMARVHPTYDSVTGFDVKSAVKAYYTGVKGTQIINIKGDVMKNPPGTGFNPFTDRL